MIPRGRDMKHRYPPKSLELFHSFEVESPGRYRKLRTLLGQQNRNHAVLVMMVNYGHMDLFRNWVRSCDDHGIDVRSWALVFTVDADAAAAVGELGFATYTDPASYGVHGKEAVQQFGDAQFRSLMFQKTAVVKDALDLGYHVLYQDVDLVWLKDPFPYLSDPQHRYFDAQFMYDGPNTLHSPLHVNTGFFWLKPTPASIRFWSAVLMHYVLILESGSQQMVANKILTGHVFAGLKLNILLEKDFANGHLFSLRNTAGLPRDPYVIHCSWTGNLDHKINKYRFAGLWYLDNEAGTSPT